MPTRVCSEPTAAEIERIRRALGEPCLHPEPMVCIWCDMQTLLRALDAETQARQQAERERGEG
jgi:hypothetical protein